MGKSITCPICRITDFLGCDLDSNIHDGFTIGKGKTMYWYITWTQNGHCFVYREDGQSLGLIRRWLNGDSLITVHFK